MGRFLAYLRKDFGISSQSAFAEKLKISRFYLSNIEAGRTALKLKAALDACRLLDVHPDFLISCGKNNRAPFPVLDRALKERMDALILANRMSNFVDAWAAIRDFFLHQSGDEADLIKKEELTDTATYDKTLVVKSEWLKLKKTIQEETAGAGGKSALAKRLRVDLTQLSKWLTDSDSAREPGADYTLKMQAWVNDPKRKK
jgi:transcriptional regulator with XRE-family HTH domain